MEDWKRVAEVGRLQEKAGSQEHRRLHKRGDGLLWLKRVREGSRGCGQDGEDLGAQETGIARITRTQQH